MLRPSLPSSNKSGYLSEDTIAAITTGVGGSIAVVRVSGPQALAAVGWLTGDPERGIRAEPRRLTRARLRSFSGEELDDALFATFVAPDSFTGEHVVELHLHGGTFIAPRILDELSRNGVRQALPGEFSFRAVRNGKMSLSQARAVADLIGATNDDAVRLALEKMSGTENRLVGDLARQLRKLAMLAEVGIDFSDQDVDEVSLPTLRRKLEPLRSTLERLRDSYRRGSRLQEGVGVAFIGVPNAGKSSFFNALLGEDRSIVSEIAGTTRDLVRERLTLGAPGRTITLRLEDTAGLRATHDQVEQMGIERSQRAARDADLILFLVDPTAPIEAARAEWRALGEPSPKTLGIVTKGDLVDEPKRRQLLETCRSLGIDEWAVTSARTGEGIQQAVEAITRRCLDFTHRHAGEVLLTRVEQLHATEAALEHLARAGTAPEIDLFAADLRHSLVALEPLIGETPPDDILGQIFANFCIGK